MEYAQPAGQPVLAQVLARLEDALLAFLSSLGRANGPARLLGKNVLAVPDQILRWLLLLRTFHGNLEAGRMVSQRDVYYSAPQHMFSDQAESNREIKALSKALGLTRLQLGVYASSRGTVVGRLLIRDGTGAWTDCGALGKEGKAIAGDLSDLGRDMVSDARFVVVVEKQGVFDELCADRFHNQMGCIIVTAAGVPDLATRAFVAHVARRFTLPVYGVADWNAGGVTVLGTYRFGSVLGGLVDGADYPCESLQWLGLLWDDVRQLPAEQRAAMSAADLARVNNVKRAPHMQGAAVQQQLALMEHHEVRAELQALRHGGRRISEWLAHKIVTRSYVAF